ncbi:very short patch repair endonuclease [Paludisphaera borealis]|uniref:very short patch repair endonuclease n=1 Tax=Paludisphaera borealis TaxID=1387353 RepID=UPI0035A39A78
MADRFSPDKRSEIMSRIRAKNTLPEVRVRSALHRLGFRFRLHRKDLPGKPDIVLPRWKTVIHVHGCFWHGHDCREGHIPKTNSGYWVPKLAKNRQRDVDNAEKLKTLGWRSIVIWECETVELQTLKVHLRDVMRTVQEELIDVPVLTELPVDSGAGTLCPRRTKGGGGTTCGPTPLI